jgi:hypothetical protein
MEDLSLHLLDIMENSIDAQADRIEVCIDQDPEGGLLTMEILDDGKGMDARMVKDATEPFFTTRTTRSVGLGLSLLSESARATGGNLTIESAPGQGTRLRATFQSSHIDMKPLGDIRQTLLILIAAHPDIDVCYRHTVAGEIFCFDTREIRNRLEGVPICSPQVLRWIGEQIREGLARLKV